MVNGMNGVGHSSESDLEVGGLPNVGRLTGPSGQSSMDMPPMNGSCTVETDDDSDDEGMSHDDIKKAVNDIFSTSNLSSRTDERHSVEYMVQGLPARCQQEALARLKDVRTALAASHSIPRVCARDYFQTCSGCGKFGHRLPLCPEHLAAIAAENGEAAAATTNGTAGKKKKDKKRSKQAIRAAEAQKTAAADGASSKAEKTEAAAAKSPSPPPPAPAAESDDEYEDAASVGEDDMGFAMQMSSMANRKQPSKATAAAVHPKASSTAAPSAADRDDAASVSSSATGGTPVAEHAGSAGKRGAAPSEQQSQQQKQQPQQQLKDKGRAAAANDALKGAPAEAGPKEAATPATGGRARDTSRAAAVQPQLQQQQNKQPQQRPQERTEPQQQKQSQVPPGLCYNCGEPGHTKRNCPHLRLPAERPRTPPQPTASAKDTIARDSAGTILGGPEAAESAPAPAQPGSWAARVASSRRSAAAGQSEPEPATSAEGPSPAVALQPPSPAKGPGENGIHAAPFPHHFHLPPEVPQSGAPAEDEDNFDELMAGLGITTDEAAPAAAAAAATTPWGAAAPWTQIPPTQSGGFDGPPLHTHPPLGSPALDQEDADFQAAVAESLRQQPRPFGMARGGPSAASASIAAPGLANETGEYNCFLNAIIQCLWRCAALRERLLAYDESCLPDEEGSYHIVKSLVALFKAFQGREEAHAGGGPQWDRQVVNPNALREALSQRHAFKLGEMNDASEVLHTLYDALKEVGEEKMVNEVFGLEVIEAVNCRKCGKQTHLNSYTQYFQNVAAASLRAVTATETVDMPSTIGRRIRMIDDQLRKTCDTDKKGCGLLNPVTHFISGVPPRVFALELGWGTMHETADDITATLLAIDEILRPGEVYQALPPDYSCKLRAMVCYYGEHYQAFVLTANAAGQERWTLLDDANASEVGDWEAVQHKCALGRIQPSVLLYQNIPAEADEE